MSIFVLIVLGTLATVYDWRRIRRRDRQHTLPKDRLVSRGPVQLIGWQEAADARRLIIDQTRDARDRMNLA